MEISTGRSHDERATSASHQRALHTSGSAVTHRQSDACSSGHSYMQLLSRITAHPSQIFSATMRHDLLLDYTDIIRLLLLQPPEIRELILSWLPPNALLALRATSRTLHDIIHQSERAICLSLAEHISASHNLAAISIAIPDFSALFRVSRQYKSICKLARVIAVEIGDHVTCERHSEDKSTFEIWRLRKIARLEQRLARAYLILQRYLNLFLDTIMRNDLLLGSLDDEDYTSLHNIFDLDQQKFMADHMPGLSEADFIDVTAALQIFKSMCKVRQVPFQHRVHIYPFASVRQVLLYKGLGPFEELLSPGANQVDQLALLTRLYKDIGLSPRLSATVGDKIMLDSIHHFHGFAESPVGRLDRRRSSKVRDKFIHHQDIWDRAARAYMMQQLGRFPIIQPPAAWITSVIVEHERASDISLGSWDKTGRN